MAPQYPEWWDFDKRQDSEIYVVERSGQRVTEFAAGEMDNVAWALNDPGTASVKMPVDDPRNAKLIQGRHELQIFVDGQMWWGIPTRISSDTEYTTYDCDELLSYYGYRFVLNATMEWEGVDQTVIAVLVHEAAQAENLHGFNIATGAFAHSGRVRSRMYEREQHQNILEILQEFGDIVDGFDIGVEYDASGYRRFVCYYPEKGQDHPGLVLEWGRNIVDYVVDEDMASLATEVYCTGGSNGEVRFEENYQDDVAAGELGTHYSAVVSDGSQKDVGWLLDRATREVGERSRPEVLPSITVIDDPVQVFGVVHPGDFVRVRIKRGRVNLDNKFRVAQVQRNSNRTTQLTLAGREVEAAA